MTRVRFMPAALLILLLAPALLPAAELSQGVKDTITIADVYVQPSVMDLAEEQRKTTALRRVSSALGSQLAAALNATQVFQLMQSPPVDSSGPERDAAAVPPESAPPTDTTAPATPLVPVVPASPDAGQPRGHTPSSAKFALIPQIDGFEDKSVVTRQQAIGRSSLHRTVYLSALVQITETATGKILPDSPAIQLKMQEDIANVSREEAVGTDQLLVNLAREMAKKLSQEAVARLRPAKVLAVTGKQVLINRGSEVGFVKGDLVEIYAVQNVKDDDTGALFSQEVPVGQAIISRVDRTQSYANITGEDLGIIKGCTVRFVKSAAARAAEAETIPEQDQVRPDFEHKPVMEGTPGSSDKPLQWK